MMAGSRNAWTTAQVAIVFCVGLTLGLMSSWSGGTVKPLPTM